MPNLPKLNFSLKKHERLNSKKLIGQLFSEGKSSFVYPFKIIFLDVERHGNCTAEILVSVSKRSFKKAVDRNRIKRLVREAYRTNKTILIDNFGNGDRTVLLGLIYVGKSILSYQEIERKIILILHRLIEQDEQTAG